MSDQYRGFNPKSDSGRNYSSGAWGKGNLDAEALAAKYGLDRSQEGRGEGHIWGRNADGSEVYIGKSNMGLASNAELIKNHGRQANPNERSHSASGEDLSSLGDIKGAILTEWKSGEGGGESGPEKPDAPVSVSPELATARARVQQYEEDVLSGRTVYGKKSFEDNDGPSFLERYKLKLGVENEDGNYVAKKDQERYDQEMSEYEKEKAAFDAEKAARLSLT